MRITIQDLQAMKARGERIAMLTAYDYPSAVIADRAGLDVLLVGDSMGMVVHGQETTLPVTVSDIVNATSAVVRGTARALVVADLPFLSYATEEDAVRSAGRLLQEAGAHAIKLEGGLAMVPIVKRLVELGVPVMGHLGYTPQSTHQIGLRAQGKTADAARRIIDDARALENAGAFAVVLELVPKTLAKAITERLAIPTIGIGAGAGCNGQVQVWHDILGLTEGKLPRHTKRYAPIGEEIEKALCSYADEVRGGTFPTDAQSVSMNQNELNAALDDEK